MQNRGNKDTHVHTKSKTRDQTRPDQTRGYVRERERERRIVTDHFPPGPWPLETANTSQPSSKMLSSVPSAALK
jgi:hypothetical protein